jgi:hypothetical protein
MVFMRLLPFSWISQNNGGSCTTGGACNLLLLPDAVWRQAFPAKRFVRKKYPNNADIFMMLPWLVHSKNLRKISHFSYDP